VERLVGAPQFSLTLIHPSAWKGYSPKFGCRILDKTA
jgi:hypothetical protein